MEKRTLLAIVISIAILLLWDFLFIGPKTSLEQQGQEEVAQEQPTVEDPAEALRIPSPQAEQAPSPVAGETVVVETPKYRARFNTMGGALSSLELKEFRQTLDPASPPVNIIEAPMPILRINGESVDSSLAYTVSRKGDADIPEELVFSTP